jgi:hypothetical protein
VPPALRAATIEDVVAVDTGFIAVGCIGTIATCDAPAIWTSGDGLAWSSPIELPVRPGEIPRPANSAAVLAGTVVVGGAVGTGDRINAALWVAADGGAFERIPDLASSADASVRILRRVDSGLVALGSQAYMEYSGFRAWYSSDGRSWAPAAPESSDEPTPYGVVLADDGIVAWGPTCGVCPPETAFWRSAVGETWTEPVCSRSARSGSTRQHRRRGSARRVRLPGSPWSHLRSQIERRSDPISRSVAARSLRGRHSSGIGEQVWCGSRGPGRLTGV